MNQWAVAVVLLGAGTACTSSEEADGPTGTGAGTETVDAAGKGDAAQADASDTDADAEYPFCVEMYRAVCDAECDWDERVLACTHTPGGMPAFSCLAEIATGDLWLSPYYGLFESVADRFRLCTESESDRALSAER